MRETVDEIREVVADQGIACGWGHGHAMSPRAATGCAATTVDGTAVAGAADPAKWRVLRISW
jgi:hypothetical protein